MNSTNNRRNHDFQIVHFLAGSCHTPDGAYALLCDLREERSDALKHARVAALRQQAKVLRAKRRLASDDEAERLEGDADLVEIEAGRETAERCLVAAQAELATIEKAMAALEPLRLYGHLSLALAHEAAQFEEWKHELIYRAENHLLTTGAIPPDQFATMRMHPAFASEIFPAINRALELMASGKKDQVLLGHADSKRFDASVLLLENKVNENSNS